jgi:hypothetical protein
VDKALDAEEVAKDALTVEMDRLRASELELWPAMLRWLSTRTPEDDDRDSVSAVAHLHDVDQTIQMADKRARLELLEREAIARRAKLFHLEATVAKIRACIVAGAVAEIAEESSKELGRAAGGREEPEPEVAETVPKPEQEQNDATESPSLSLSSSIGSESSENEEEDYVAEQASLKARLVDLQKTMQELWEDLKMDTTDLEEARQSKGQLEGKVQHHPPFLRS